MLKLLALAAALAAPNIQGKVVAGWCDELNSLSGWSPREGGMKAEAYAEIPGSMTLRLAHVPDGFPYSYRSSSRYGGRCAYWPATSVRRAWVDARRCAGQGY